MQIWYLRTFTILDVIIIKHLDFKYEGDNFYILEGEMNSRYAKLI